MVHVETIEEATCKPARDSGVCETEDTCHSANGAVTNQPSASHHSWRTTITIIVILAGLTIASLALAEDPTHGWTLATTGTCKLWNGRVVPCEMYTKDDAVRVAVHADFSGIDEIAVIKEYSAFAPLREQQGKVVYWNPKLQQRR